MFHPSSIEEVQEIVLMAKEQNKKIMTGNEKFASQIDAACADKGSIQITLKNMTNIVEIDQDAMTVTAEAGIRFNKLNEALDKKRLAVNMVTELNLSL